MKTLTTRKIIFGLMMTFVLAFGMQGIIDAATIDTFTADPADLSWRGINSSNTITFTIAVSASIDGSNEFATFSVTNGATFPDPNDPTKNIASYTWRETGDTAGDGSQGTFTGPGSFVVTVKNPGEVTATLSAHGATTQTMTFYVVKHPFSVSPQATVGLINLTNGVGGRYSGDVKIHSGDGQNNPVIYSVSASGTLYIQKGTDTSRRLALTTPFKTSSNADVWLTMVASTSHTVTVGVDPGGTKTEGVYIHGNPRLAVATVPASFAGPPDSVEQSGTANAITVEVKDQTAAGLVGSTVPDVPVKFDVADKITGGYLIPTSTDADSDGFSDNIVNASNKPIRHTDVPAATRTVYVRSTASGASVGFQFGTVPGKSDVTVSVTGRNVNLTEKVEARVTGDTLTTLSIATGYPRTRSGNSKIFDLVALVERDGKPVHGLEVTFRTRYGALTSTPTGEGGITNPDGGTDVTDFGTGTDAATTAAAKGLHVGDITDRLGRAQVIYDIGNNSGRQEIDASIYTNSVKKQEVTFVVNGPADTSGSGNQGSGASGNTISISPSSITGEAGTTQSLTVSAGTATVRVVDASAFTTAGGTISGSGATRSVTLPDTPGSTYTITLGASGYTDVTVPVIVTAALANGTLTPTLGTRAGNQQPITVRAVRGGSARSGVNITITGGATSYTRTTDSSGSISLIIRLPTATSAHTLTLRATGYDPAEVTVPAPGQPTRDPSQPTTTRGSGGVADSIQVSGQVFRTGRLNTQLDLPLSVRVLDGNNTGVENVKVTFRVQTGQGRLSQRGNGRATAVETDRSGYARAPYTPLARGTSTVRVNAAGVTQTVTFTITVDGATGDTGTDTGDSTSDTTAPQTYNVRDEIPISLEGTLTFSGKRTEKGMTYTCVGSGECVVSYGTVVKGQIQATPEKTAAPQTYKVRDEIPISLEDTLTFSGSRTEKGMTYTCVGSGECVVSYGTVVRGQIQATPEKTAAPSTGDATPRVTEMNPEVLLDSSQRPWMYWVDSGAIFPLVGYERGDHAAISPVFSNSGVNAIAVSGNAIYWTEQTGENAGTINTANFGSDGSISDTKQLVSIKAVPRGIAVDPVAERLYWTNSQGWIQSSNLEGKQRRNVISGGLENPTGITVGSGWLYWIADGRPWGMDLPTAIANEDTIFYQIETDSAEGIAIFEGKIYWTEMTGKNAGTINSANLDLDGTAGKQLVSIKAVPKGIAIDPVAKRLYWTNSQGWIQSSNLEGTARRNVAKGLGSPGGIALSANIKAPAAKSTTTKSTTTAANKYDVNGDGTVDGKDSDALIVAVAAGVTDAKYDVNGDGKVDFNDVVAVTAHRSGGAAGAPTLLGRKFSALEVDRLQEQIDLLVASGDRSPAAMQTLIYLQQLIVMARPEKTQLLANYPNPFNPETWMPYELATDTDVRITIYNAQGVVIRTLQLGQQSAGYYTDRERAAYWDGRNALGERVASGIYFYQLETDDMSSLRKMVILK